MDDSYGATYYSTQRDGVSVQMLYKQIPMLINDGTTQLRWHYLSYCNLWMGSCNEPEFYTTLKPIENLK